MNKPIIIKDGQVTTKIVRKANRRNKISLFERLEDFLSKIKTNPTQKAMQEMRKIANVKPESKIRKEQKIKLMEN